MKRRSFAKLLALGAGSQLIGDAETGEAANAEAAEAADPDPAAEVAADLSKAVVIDDYVELSRKKLPRATWEYISTGCEGQVTLHDNIEAFRRIGVLPPILHGVGAADLSTTVLGQKIAMPVMLAPVAGLRMYHPDGALASARAAGAAGTICAVSSSAFHSAEEIGAAGDGPKWFQIYMPKDNGVARALIERVEAAGFKALVVTVDLGERKDADRRNKFGVPKQMLLKHLRDVGHKQLHDGMSQAEIEAFNLGAWRLSMSWDIIDWLRGITRLPLVVKGILGTSDARRAVKEGADAIVVSNHGGRRLDGMPASIDRMRAVADEVNGKTELLLDSGIRRGTDVMKALALGARAVLVGRPQAWSLAAGGEAGVRQMLEYLRQELEMTMISCGCPDVGSINANLLLNQPTVG
ncbi:MAG: alpha-hydroxy acid oxidase [Planctomycetaceae bacterium]|jgi:isopentenyl diphosphate isomerase/L-lactate dehydrogenase-like FMN-dependent dehydrogenase|nr:alpha-hydroxy acid oxidase [Planctomycetaceae bacterium]